MKTTFGYTRIELRKLVDTRASLWVIGSLGFIGVAISISLVFRTGREIDVANVFAGTQLFFSLIASVIGMLGMCGDWAHRDAVYQWPLVRSRSSLFAAKILACVLAGFAAFALETLAIVIPIGVRLAFGARANWTAAESKAYFAFGLILLGVAFGCGVAGVVRRMAPAVAVILILHIGVNLFASTLLPSALQGAVSTLAPLKLFDTAMPVSMWDAIASLLVWYVAPLLIAWRIYVRAEL